MGKQPDLPLLRLIQTCIICCIKWHRVGRFNTCKKCGQLKSSLFYCVLRSPPEWAITNKSFVHFVFSLCLAHKNTITLFSPMLTLHLSILDRTSSFEQCFFKNGPLFVYFCLFKQTIQFLQQINVNKYPSSLRCWDSHSQASEHESPPITTRPGLPLWSVFIEMGTLSSKSRLLTSPSLAADPPLNSFLTGQSWSLFLYFRLFNTVDSKQMFHIKVCWWLVSNHGPLVSEATEPQPLNLLKLAPFQIHSHYHCHYPWLLQTMFRPA